eukprot:9479026-Pyramimonas_sp.AAC.1
MTTTTRSAGAARVQRRRALLESVGPAQAAAHQLAVSVRQLAASGWLVAVRRDTQKVSLRPAAAPGAKVEGTTARCRLPSNGARNDNATCQVSERQCHLSGVRTTIMPPVRTTPIPPIECERRPRELVTTPIIIIIITHNKQTCFTGIDRKIVSTYEPKECALVHL